MQPSVHVSFRSCTGRSGSSQAHPRSRVEGARTRSWCGRLPHWSICRGSSRCRLPVHRATESRTHPGAEAEARHANHARCGNAVQPSTPRAIISALRRLARTGASLQGAPPSGSLMSGRVSCGNGVGSARTCAAHQQDALWCRARITARACPIAGMSCQVWLLVTWKPNGWPGSRPPMPADSAPGRVSALPPTVTACTEQGTASARSGQAASSPLCSDRSGYGGAGVKHKFACTFTGHRSLVLVALRSQSR
jgi:hypothetical protein